MKFENRKFEEISAIVMPNTYLEDMTELDREQFQIIPLEKLEEDSDYRTMLIMAMEDYEVIQDYILDQLEMRLLAYHNARLLAIYDKVIEELVKRLERRFKIVTENYEKFKRELIPTAQVNER